MSKSTIQPTVELAAQSLEVGEIQNRITQVEASIKPLQHEVTKIRNGGHDIFQFGLPVDFVKKVTRDFPTDATLKLAAAFELEHIKPLREQLAELKTRLSAEQVTLGQLRVEFKSANAERLLEQTIERLAEAASAVTDAKAHHASLEQRLSAARMGLLEAGRLKTEHSAAAAQALLDGLDVPVLALPPLEEVGPLQSALALSKAKISSLGDAWSSINSEVQHLKGLISNRKVNDFVVEVKAQAAAAGVDLKAVRDKLTDAVGPSLMHQMDADELARLRHEVSTLRPENAQLKADKATLQNGILQASKKYA